MRWAIDRPRDAGLNRIPRHAPLILAVAGCAGACAREAPPPGAPPDARPPAIVEIEPESRAIVPDWSGSARVRFDEPIAARQVQNTVVGSPAARYDVDVGRSQIRIRPLSGGWLAGAIYRFTIPEGIGDLMGNRTSAPIEILFSTGPDFSGSRIDGSIVDRVTGSPVSSARVIFLATSGDSVPYTAVSGTDGLFSLPETPFGEYRAFAFEDRNTSLFLERRFESYDSLVVTIDAESPTAELQFRLVEPDTTPPVLLRAEAVDSLTLRLEFDDHLDPDQSWEPGQVRVVLEDTGRAWPVSRVRLGEPPRAPGQPDGPGVGEDGDVAPDSVVVPPDSLEAAPDSLQAPPDSLDAAAPDSLLLPADQAIPTDTLPSTVLSAELAEPLAAGLYRVTAEGLRNLRNLIGGGDTTFVYPAPDSLAVPGGGP